MTRTMKSTAKAEGGKNLAFNIHKGGALVPEEVLSKAGCTAEDELRENWESGPLFPSRGAENLCSLLFLSPAPSCFGPKVDRVGRGVGLWGKAEFKCKGCWERKSSSGTGHCD